jgi:AmmeMemoRadiSam system radical SAM enzyme/AmmeMemoRadiSam system protein B/AmmeMemoRadiSam system protein A
MSRVVTLPPSKNLRPDGALAGGWWHDEASGGRIVCDLCPRECHLKPGDRGFCFVRQNLDGEMVLTTYGRSTGFCIDPIEKKPLNHFYPGTSVLSFGTAGCNLGCKFCQNWDISKSREVERLSELATPEAIAEAARQHDCRSVAFTYNDPVIWAEYAIETARACRAVGIKTVAVTAGYITPAARRPFFEVMDASNVDLKGFTEDFYQHITYSHLQPVLDTLEWLKKETDVWFEITNLVIPGANDGRDDIRRMCQWIMRHVGDDVPVHFTAFHPDFRMRDRPHTPREILLEAYETARQEGLKYVYIGNVNDVVHQSTYCPDCGHLVIERDWYALGAYRLRGNHCGNCGGRVAGHFDERPGTWGRKRVPVEIARFARDPQPINLIESGALMKTIQLKRSADAPEVTFEQRALIVSAAAEFVAATIVGRSARMADPTLSGAAGLPVMGAYVTLKRQGQLRACCGSLGETRPLIEAVHQAAVITARDDYRLPPISRTELPYLELSVNLLHGLRRMNATGRDRIDAVEVGRHGLRIHRGSASGLLLPTVPVENGWDVVSYLRHVCRKAGLPTTAWEDEETVLYTFESIEFGGPFDSRVTEDLPPQPTFGPAELQQLAEHARTNILALAQGWTPSYYQYGLSDGNIAGLAITVQGQGEGATAPHHFVQLSLRPGVPLQATLFQLCEQAAQTLGRANLPLNSIRVGLTVFSDPAMHGTVDEPDLRGLNPANRALLLIEHDKNAWIYAPSLSPEDQFGVVTSRVRVLHPGQAALYSLSAHSTEPEFVFHSAPRPIISASTRPPAVAGKFYPASPEELTRKVESLLAASVRREEDWPAAMVPHAGLSYSGGLAAAVFNRIKIPDLVLILGPKHTRLGVEWSVAPHETWSIPGGSIDSDPDLARKLTEAIPGLQLDAAAHQQEHAIEVELPFLARLAPDTRVLGLAIGGGDWRACREFAEGLAGFVRGLRSRPLLVISSDMNHFASDRENRRLDAIALEAMERLDPIHLLTTVNEHQISMCGVLPAVIVMETLRLLGGLTRCERVGYATSADVTGDTSRVVGYAGVLLG